MLCGTNIILNATFSINPITQMSITQEELAGISEILNKILQNDNEVRKAAEA